MGRHRDEPGLATWEEIRRGRQDYEAEKIRIDRLIVGRLARGNVLVQDGYILSKAEFELLSKEGDRACAALPE